MSQGKGQDAGVLTPEELLIALRATEETEEWRCDWPGCDDGYEGNRYCRKCRGEPVRPSETILINPQGPQAADTIERLQAKVGVLEGAVSTFLAKYDECKPHIDDAFLHRQLRCGDYTGPNFAEELTALRKANLTKEG